MLLSLLGIVAVNATSTKRSFRGELAEQLRSSGYSLADVYGGDAYVVSVDNRTLKATKLKYPEKLASVECSSPEGRYFVFHRHGGLWLRDNESGEALQVEAEGQFSTQCFSPEGKFVYSSKRKMKIYDLARKTRMDVGEGDEYPTWSPDGKWLGFDEGKHFMLLDLKTGTRKKLFSTKDSAGPNWSPDSRYLTYTKPGGGTGGFLFWGIKCIEPYRVWGWRVEDDAHDGVQEICKPGRSFTWVKNSDLLFDQPTDEESLSAITPLSWRKVDAGPFSILAPPGWESHQLMGVDSYVGEFAGDAVVLRFDFAQHSRGYPERAEKPTYVIAHESIGGFSAKIVSPRTPGHGVTGTFIGNSGNGCHALSHSNSITLPHSPAAPPRMEINNASVRSCRTTRARRTPSASLMAISREQSAARAVNRLPRLACAAARIKAASSTNPARNARTAPPNRSPISGRPNGTSPGSHSGDRSSAARSQSSSDRP